MSIEVHYFDSSVRKFIDALEPMTIAKALRTIDLLATFGHRLGMPHSRALKNGLFELRVRGVQEARLIYCFHASGVIFLHAFLKKTQETASRDLVIAQARQKQVDGI